MAMFGLPHEVLQGALVGMSVGGVIMFELPKESPLAQVLMKTKNRRMICSTLIGICLGIFTDPMTTIVAELPIYGSMCLKGNAVEKHLKSLLEPMEPGDTYTVEYDGWDHKFHMPTTNVISIADLSPVEMQAWAA